MSDELSVGMIVRAECKGLGSKGDGVFRLGKSQFVVIVPQAVVGKTYEIEITHLLEKNGFGIIKREC